MGRRRKKLEEERRIAKQNRRIVSSDEDCKDENIMDNQTSSDNEKVESTKGNSLVTEKEYHSSDDQSSWSDEGGKNKGIANCNENDNSNQSDSDAPLKKRNRRGKKPETSDSSTDDLSDEEPRPKR